MGRRSGLLRRSTTRRHRRRGTTALLALATAALTLLAAPAVTAQTYVDRQASDIASLLVALADLASVVDTAAGQVGRVTLEAGVYGPLTAAIEVRVPLELLGAAEGGGSVVIDCGGGAWGALAVYAGGFALQVGNGRAAVAAGAAPVGVGGMHAVRSVHTCTSILVEDAEIGKRHPLSAMPQSHATCLQLGATRPETACLRPIFLLLA